MLDGVSKGPIFHRGYAATETRGVAQWVETGGRNQDGYGWAQMIGFYQEAFEGIGSWIWQTIITFFFLGGVWQTIITYRIEWDLNCEHDTGWGPPVMLVGL